MVGYVLRADPEVAAALVDGMRLRGIEALLGSSADALLEHAKERAPSLLAIPAEWLAGDGSLAPAAFHVLRAAVGGAPEVGIPPLDVHDASALDAVLEEIERTFAPHHPAPPSARGAELEGDLASTPLLD